MRIGGLRHGRPEWQDDEDGGERRTTTHGGQG
jgi:hypothetical protein